MMLADLLDATPNSPTPRDVAQVLWWFGLLLGVGVGLLAAVLLALRYLRRAHAPPPPRPTGQTLDPWMEAGRRVKDDDVI